MTPDFSPRMLRLFLEARIVRAMMLDGLARAKARTAIFRGLGKAAGLPARTVEIAHGGHANSATTRVRLWAALGIFPADAGVRLTDDGGQVPA